MQERYLITAALPYVNNVPHIGNIAGSHLPADVFARYCRLKGRRTLFIGGTDENGAPSEIAAEKAGVPVRELCDTFFGIHRRIYEWFGLSYDNFSRTSRSLHHEITKEFFLELQAKGFIFEKEMRQPYCPKDKRFLADRFVEGKCPKCAAQGARGDQCEKCSSMLNPDELLEPYCVLCKSKPEIRETMHLFLDLEKLQPELKKWVGSQKHWKPQVKNLALGWLAEGLKKRCITRDLKWGVKVPVRGYEDKVFYVWFDAPIGYISSTKEWILKNTALKGREEKEFAAWWKRDPAPLHTKLYHFIGKDNIPFHTIFFPAMLIGNGSFIMPHQVAGYQFLNYEGGKISKSKGRGVFCESFVESKELSGDADLWRFFLTYRLPEVRDTEFTWKEFQSRINTELLGNLGNLVHRISTFIAAKKGAIVPEKPPHLSKEDEKMLAGIDAAVKKVDALYDDIEFVAAIQAILELSAECNRYFQAAEPWKNPARQDAVLYAGARTCAALSVLLSPVMPATAAKIRKVFGLKKKFAWDDALAEDVSGKPVAPEIIRERLTDEQIAQMKLLSTKVGGVEERMGKHRAQKD
ncbi:MAG: methionine--tRNA ligase [Candidatus Micrarchaeota archaeon]